MILTKIRIDADNLQEKSDARCLANGLPFTGPTG